MYDVELFLGFPIHPSFATALEQVDPQIISLFICEGQNYLQEVTYQNRRYLGKFAGKLNDISGLCFISDHIYSLLKRIVSDYPYEKQPLILFPSTLVIRDSNE